jgi:transposase
MKEKRSNEEILKEGMTDIQAICEGLLKITGNESPEIARLKKEAISGLEQMEKPEEFPEIIKEENLGKPVVKKMAFGGEEYIDMTASPQETEELDAEEMQRLKEMLKEKQEKAKGDAFEDLKEIEEEIAEHGVPIAPQELVEQKESKLSYAVIKPAQIERRELCPKCNKKLRHQSKIVREGEGYFAVNTETCSNKGKKKWGKIIEVPCSYQSQSVARID